MNKKPTVTIGIPAYNEEANIGNLLRSLLERKRDNFTLKEIIVVSDGSTDNTVNIVKTIKNKNIRVIAGKARKGKSHRLNEITKINKSDYLILIDADSVIEKKAISEMVKKFIKNKKLGLIAGNQLVVKNKGLIEKALSARETVFKEIRKNKNGKNVYVFRGGFLGIKKELAKTIVVPNISGNDAYLYFFAKKKGYSVGYCEKAIAKFSLPDNINDHLKQSHRFVDSQREMKKYFGEIVVSEYQLNKKLLLKAIWNVGKKQPINLFLYLLIYLYSNLLSYSRKVNTDGIWDISQSTKKAIVN